MDSAVIAGVELKDIVAGKISEAQIPKEVVTAFHAQYPGIHRSFTDEVHKLASHPVALQGFVNGVKGKLFEVQYADWLNHGHLPPGFHADLAHAANNPAWDISITDSHGHVNKFLQLKASSDLHYIQHAIEAHPNIDVVVPRDVYQHLAHHAETASNLVDSHQSLGDLNSQVGAAVDHADIAFHIPVLAVAFAVGHSFHTYRTGRVPFGQAIRAAVERSGLAVVASAVGWLAGLAAHEPMVGLPFAVVTRIFGLQAFHNLRRREQLSEINTRCRKAINSLSEKISCRPTPSSPVALPELAGP